MSSKNELYQVICDNLVLYVAPFRIALKNYKAVVEQHKDNPHSQVTMRRFSDGKDIRRNY